MVTSDPISEVRSQRPEVWKEGPYDGDVRVIHQLSWGPSPSVRLRM